MQVVVTERGRAQDLRVGEQVRVLVGEVGKIPIGLRVAQDHQGCLGALVIALRRGQSSFQKLGPPRISTDHLRHFGVGHPHLRGGLRHRAGDNSRIDGHTVADTPDGLSHAVIRTANKVDLAQLCEDFQHEIVSIGLFDLRYQGQQQIPGPDLVGGKRQTTGALQFARDRHGCIISLLPRRCDQPGAADV